MLVASRRNVWFDEIGLGTNVIVAFMNATFGFLFVVCIVPIVLSIIRRGVIPLVDNSELVYKAGWVLVRRMTIRLLSILLLVRVSPFRTS